VAIGVPSFFLALGGQGYLRGVSDLTSPLVLIVLANSLNVVLEVLFVYGFGWGIEGSAWGTAIAQSCMGAGFVWLIVSRAGRENMAPAVRFARRLLSVGKFIFVRTAALISAFLPERCHFAINTHVANRWWVKPAFHLFDLLPIDPGRTAF